MPLGEEPRSPPNCLLVPSVVLEEDRVLLSPASDQEVGAGGMLVQSLLVCCPWQDLTGRGCSLGFSVQDSKVPLQGQEGESWGPGPALRVDAEPSQGSADPSFTSPSFSWKNSCTLISGPGSKEKLAGSRLQIS